MLSFLCWGLCLTAWAEEYRYRGVCDVSAAALIDGAHFIVGNDEDEILSLYTSDGSTTTAIRNFDFASRLRSDPDRESDIEDAARRENRIYWISSHSRSKKGKIRGNRYRLFATDVAYASSELQLHWAGRYDRLLTDMLDSRSWDEPDSSITRETMELLARSTRLDRKTVDELDPKDAGLNIEALAIAPDRPGLLIGLRNPLARGRAMVVHLKNPDALLDGSGERARFSTPLYIDLGGLGLRSMAYDATGRTLFMIAGPSGKGGPFRLFRWDGRQDRDPVLLRELPYAPGAYPEALLVHGRQLQILSDEGGRTVNSRACKRVSREERGFGEQWYHLDAVATALPE